jgi:hypothetical protein
MSLRSPVDFILWFSCNRCKRWWRKSLVISKPRYGERLDRLEFHAPLRICEVCAGEAKEHIANMRRNYLEGKPWEKGVGEAELTELRKHYE